MKRKTKIVYKARIGAKFGNKEAQAIGKEFDRIKERHNKLNPDIIVNEAKSKSSILHKYFEWNVQRASYQYNLQQARDLINHIVEIRIIEKKPVMIRSFFPVHENDGEMVYAKIEEVMENADFRIETYNKAISTLHNLKELLIVLRDNKS